MTIPVWVGYDEREAAAYTVFCQSVIERASQPVAFKPLALHLMKWFANHKDGTNNFITSRYMIPCLEDFSGWVRWADGDMVCRRDIAELWALRDERYAVMRVPHEYKTRHPRKYIGSPIENDNLDYPKKNQSSVMLLNCGHPALRKLTPSYVVQATSQHLHRFEWLDPALIGDLPDTWNHLCLEQPLRDDAALVHFTCGIPGFDHYTDSEHARDWHRSLLKAVNVVGESPVEMMRRAEVRA
jgi:lipopolysaccharide biosynthesis glycosyltransferase